MKEKIKIISDGETAEIYINGKKVRCSYIQFIGNARKRPMVRAKAEWYDENEHGKLLMNEQGTEIRTKSLKINWN